MKKLLCIILISIITYAIAQEPEKIVQNLTSNNHLWVASHTQAHMICGTWIMPETKNTMWTVTIGNDIYTEQSLPNTTRTYRLDGTTCDNLAIAEIPKRPYTPEQM
ncbi:hypothetical protein [Emticicia sp. C21]|uniref:hypothetical protein n=1 Tax=Emticicia sp. C21 TaxID=2302915 RepID=UPI000E35065E|nr:hypothetical protein [Emticicia sp. C21]RFS18429.1 hypothetical protein D0T08_04035 [Emticicia sp. C21]